VAVEPGEEVADGAGRFHALEREPPRHLQRADRHADDVAEARRVLALLLPELERGRDLLGAHLHPLAADADERALEPREGAQLREGQRHAAHGHLPLEVDEVVEAQPARTLHLRARDRSREGQPGARALPRPPRGEEEAEARLLENHGPPAQEVESAGRVQSVAGKSRTGQAHLDPPVDPRSLAKAGQQMFANVEARSGSGAGSARQSLNASSAGTSKLESWTAWSK
jgi:hypothetical protein